MKTIFDTASLRGAALRNRVFRSATWLALAGEDGQVNDDIVAVYRGLAQGGAGGIVTGLVSVAPHDAWLDGGVKFHDDRFIDSHRVLTGAVHSEGAKIWMQTAITASVRPAGGGRLTGADIDSLSAKEIADRVRWFGEAARRAERAGYDGVQIHAAHFFFLSRFISPLFNHRHDDYGGSPERRARILVDVLQSVRQMTGEGFSVIVKLNASDMTPGGLSVADFLVAGRMLSEAGIDAIEVSANGTSIPGVRPGRGEAYFKDFAVALTKVAKAPVILVGGLRTLAEMNNVLNTTDIEFLSLSRPLVREPGLLRRWEAGDTGPALCISCNQCYSTVGHECIFNIGR